MIARREFLRVTSGFAIAPQSRADAERPSGNRPVLVNNVQSDWYRHYRTMFDEIV